MLNLLSSGALFYLFPFGIFDTWTEMIEKVIDGIVDEISLEGQEGKCDVVF